LTAGTSTAALWRAATVEALSQAADTKAADSKAGKITNRIFTMRTLLQTTTEGDLWRLRLPEPLMGYMVDM
jgi:hypothetical protein